MIDNINLIKPLLTFKEDGDFYRLNIYVRKKDQSTDLSNHQSVRTIKSYSIYSIDYLEKKYDEIKHLCEYFKARAYISLQRLNDKDVALLMLKELADKLYSEQHKMEWLYDSVVGKIHSKDKRWVVDIDKEELKHSNLILDKINSLEPEGDKLIAEIPTKSGKHFITHPFRVDKFQNWCKINSLEVAIQKNNPTCLFLPNSLTRIQMIEKESLKNCLLFYDCLVEAGINNWDGYEKTQDLYKTKSNDRIRNNDAFN